MEQMLRIQQEEDSAKGAFVIDSHGKRIAEILWRFEDENNIEVYRTFTDPSLRGKGVAGHLVERVANLARERQLRINASCSNAYKWLSASDEFRGLLK